MQRGTAGASVPVTLLGHKGDLMLIHLRRSFEELQRVEAEIGALGLTALLEPTTSFVSMVELSLYEMTMQIHKRLGERGLKTGSDEFELAFDAEMEEQRKRVSGRLFIEPPPRRHVCFYPMNKRRGEHKNWYVEPMEDRARMMLDHGKIGRHYSGRVTQVISGADRLRRLGVGCRPLRRRPARLQEADLRDALRRGLGLVRRVRAVLRRAAVLAFRAAEVPRGPGPRAEGLARAMRSQARVLLLVLGVLPLSGCGGDGSMTGPTPNPSGTPANCAAGTPVSGIPPLSGRLVVSGLRDPLDLQSVAGDFERLYVVEQGGRIRVVRNGQIAGTFLDVAGRLSSGGERGLLGLAFHPQFATNRRFFVNYTNPVGDTHISEFRASSADAADASSERILLVVGQPFANHNGGGLAFDNAGRLLIALGDGGSGGDPMNNGQRLDTLLGKLLRIDVDGTEPYGLPADNPFLARPGARGEIWAYGLRNPFKIAIDRPTGDLYIGDVGQNRVEEIDVDPGSRRGGLNYGWRLTEGSQCFNPSSGCGTAGADASRSTSTRTRRGARSRAASSTAAAASPRSRGRTSSPTTARRSCARSASRTGRRPSFGTGPRACAASTRRPRSVSTPRASSTSSTRTARSTAWSPADLFLGGAAPHPPDPPSLRGSESRSAPRL